MARRENLTETLYRLEPGENRHFPIADDKTRRTLRTVAWRLGKEEGRVYVTRTVDEGCYVARVA